MNSYLNNYMNKHHHTINKCMMNVMFMWKKMHKPCKPDKNNTVTY